VPVQGKALATNPGLKVQQKGISTKPEIQKTYVSINP